MRTSDFLTAEKIISDVLKRVGDENLSTGLVKSDYLSMVKDALTQFAIDSRFFRKDEYLELDSNKVEYPLWDDCLELDKIYVFNGECCEPASNGVKNVYYKRNYKARNKGEGYFGNNRTQMDSDPFYQPSYKYSRSETGLYYANVEDQKIMFSKSCITYEKAFITYISFGGKIDEHPVIPRIAENAIRDWVTVEALMILSVKNRDLLGLLDRYELRLNGKGRGRGSWLTSVLNVKSMPRWKRDSFSEYLSKMNY